MKYQIYKIINKATDMIYIGATSNFRRRCWQHKNMLKNDKHKNKYLQKDYNLHGLNAFEFKIVDNARDLEELHALEKFYIGYYCAGERDYGYNISIGGPGGRTGIKLSGETKRKMSLAKKGKKKSEETKKKMGIALRKPISQFDKNGTFLRNWSSATEASRSLNIRRGNISACCSEKYGYKTAGGYKWKLKNC